MFALNSKNNQITVKKSLHNTWTNSEQKMRNDFNFGKKTKMFFIAIWFENL